MKWAVAHLEAGFKRLPKMIKGTLQLTTTTLLSAEIAYWAIPTHQSFLIRLKDFASNSYSLFSSNALQTLSIRIAFDTTIIDKGNAHCTKPLAHVLTQQGFPQLRHASLECDIHLLKRQNAISFNGLIGMDLSSRYEKDFRKYSTMNSLKFSCLVRVVD